MKYRPHRWVLFKVVTPRETLFKVLAGWSGGYLDSDRWKINSGITKVEENLTHYRFYGYSGSVYTCHKEGEGFTGLTASVWRDLSLMGGVSLSDIEELTKELK